MALNISVRKCPKHWKRNIVNCFLIFSRKLKAQWMLWRNFSWKSKLIFFVSIVLILCCPPFPSNLNIWECTEMIFQCKANKMILNTVLNVKRTNNSKFFICFINFHFAPLMEQNEWSWNIVWEWECITDLLLTVLFQIRWKKNFNTISYF